MLTIETPGSKSISNRYLILAALAKQKITIKNIADCNDTKLLIKALNQLGVKFELKNKTLKIDSSKLIKDSNTKINLYTSYAGTTTRFLTALCSTLNSQIEIDGDKRMRERPIGTLTQALKKLGANLSATKNNFVPININNSKIQGGQIKIPGNTSSQFITALLLILPFAITESKIEIINELCSKPYIDITLKCLEDFNLKALNDNYKSFTIPPHQTCKKNIKLWVEPDASSSSYPAAFTALHPHKKILLKNLHPNFSQGDIKFLEYLKKMGCSIEDKKKGTILKSPKKLNSLGEVDMNKTPDLVMTFATLSIFSEGKTKIKNVSNLRIKECDRLSALENELSKLKVPVKVGEDFIEIESNIEIQNRLKNNQEKIIINTYNDHRIAMCFGILRSLIPNLEIENPNCVQKSYTSFWQDLAYLEKNI